MSVKLYKIFLISNFSLKLKILNLKFNIYNINFILLKKFPFFKFTIIIKLSIIFNFINNLLINDKFFYGQFIND